MSEQEIFTLVEAAVNKSLESFKQERGRVASRNQLITSVIAVIGVLGSLFTIGVGAGRLQKEFDEVKQNFSEFQTTVTNNIRELDLRVANMNLSGTQYSQVAIREEQQHLNRVENAISELRQDTRVIPGMAKDLEWLTKEKKQ